MNEDYLKYYKLIGQINSSISKCESYDEALKNCINILVEKSSAEYAILWYFNDKDAKFHPYYWLTPCDLTSISYDKDESPLAEAFNENKIVPHFDVDEISDSIKEKAINLDISSLVYLPFKFTESRKGVLEVIKTNDKFNEDDIDIFQILAMLIEMAINEMPNSLDEWETRNKIMTVNNVTKSFKNGPFVTSVLKGVSFDVFEGEFLCFLGESGCGKSTLLNIIGGMDSLDSGSFSFLGKDLSTASESELTDYRRDNVGFIFQNYNLMPNLTAKENIDLIGELVKNPMNSMDALKIVKLDDKANNYPSQLSGGQQQRISIARALTKRPKVIMADEPTAALDYETSIEVLSALEDVVKSGTTLIMVTHNEEITKMAHRVIKFRNGKVYQVTINKNRVSATDLVW